MDLAWRDHGGRSAIDEHTMQLPLVDDRRKRYVPLLFRLFDTQRDPSILPKRFLEWRMTSGRPPFSQFFRSCSGQAQSMPSSDLTPLNFSRAALNFSGPDPFEFSELL
jgi:hypothetical protein